MRTSPPPRSLSLDRFVAASGVAVALSVTLYGVWVHLRLRPLDGVEGDLLFEASRIRSGLSLYTDPVVGAADYGPVPARYYVLYPPLWALLLSSFPSASAFVVARALSALAWWGLLGYVAATARATCRGPAVIAAGFVGGIYSLAEFGGSARPDAMALLLAGLALVRSVRKGEVDVVAGALFALAAWTKPNVIGLAPGAFLACSVVARRPAIRGAIGAGVVSVGIAATLYVVSDGAWLAHLRAATGQPLHARLLVGHLASRAQFFWTFFGFAGFCAWRRAPRAIGDPGATIAWGALVTSTLWCTLSFAKIGSAANYWMEPCVASVVALAHVPLPDLSRRGRLVVSLGLALQVLWTGVGSVRATIEALAVNAARSALLERARSVCKAGPDALVVADEPGIEMTLDGRLVAHPFPLTHVALAGKYPLGPWLRDLRGPSVGCVVTAHDRIERPLTDVDVDYDYFAPPVREALFDRFSPVAEAAGWEVYALRPRASKR